MISITFVVCILFAVLLFQGISLQKKSTAYKAKQESLTAEIEQEEVRTQEIEDLKTYMQSEEYMEKIARDKLGLVKENEIVFKEE